MSRRVGLAAGAAAVLLLAGCTATTPEPTPTDGAPSSSPPATSPATTPTPTALAHPACDELVPLTVVKENFSSTAVLYETPGDADREQAASWLDPAAQTTLAAADNVQFCDWIVEGGSDGGVAVFTAQLAEADRDELVSALESSTYTPVQISDATAFGLAQDSEVSARYAVQAFLGSAWVIAVGSGSVDHGVPVAQAAVDSLRETNPLLVD